LKVGQFGDRNLAGHTHLNVDEGSGEAAGRHPLVGIRSRSAVNAGQVDEFCDAADDGLAQARLWPRRKLRPPEGASCERKPTTA
jgi:hypothetical protein